MMNPNYKVFWSTVFKLFGTENVVFLDIEVQPSVGKGSWDNEHKIIAAAVSDTYSEPKIFLGKEESILSELQAYFYNNKPLAIVGYGIMYLDIPFLIYKCRQYDYRYKHLLRTLETTPVLDLTEAVSQYMYKKTGEYKLHSLSSLKELHGIDKQDFSEELYNNPYKLREYMKKDIEAIRNLYRFLTKEYFQL